MRLVARHLSQSLQGVHLVPASASTGIRSGRWSLGHAGLEDVPSERGSAAPDLSGPVRDHYSGDLGHCNASLDGGDHQRCAREGTGRIESCSE